MPDLVWVVDAELDAYRRDLTESVVQELRDQGTQIATSPEQPEARQDRVVLTWEPLRRPEAYADFALRKTLPRTMFVTTGFDRGEIATHRRLLARAGACVALDPRSVFWMQMADVRAHLLRPGYSRGRDRFVRDAPRRISVLFVGPRTERTAALLDECAERLGGSTVIETRFVEDGDTSIDRFALYADAKIVLQIGAEEGARFDWGAAVDAIGCGAVVVCERAAGLSHLVPGKHLLAGSPEGLPYVLAHLLASPQQQETLRIAAYERIKDWFPLSMSAGTLWHVATTLAGEPDLTVAAEREIDRRFQAATPLAADFRRRLRTLFRY